LFLKVVLAVGLGLVAGFVVVIIYFVVQFLRRSVTKEYKYKKLTSDPAYVSRAVIKQDIPPFYIPQPVPVPLQQPPIRSERSGSISKDDYRNGHSLLSATVHSVNVKRKVEDHGTGIQLNAINTGPISPPLTPRSSKPPRKFSPMKKQPPPKENLSLPQHRKVAVYKNFPTAIWENWSFPCTTINRFVCCRFSLPAG